MTKDNSNRDQRGETIDVSVALRHATLEVRKAAATGPPDLEPWADAEIDPSPLVIHDLNGQTLFYDFSVDDLGVVRCAANTLVGNPVVALQLGPHKWRAPEAEKQAKKAFDKESGDKPGATSLVCYNYPKIGVRVSGEGEQGLSSSVIYDVADGIPVETFGAEEGEGLTSYSFLDLAAQDADLRLRRWSGAESEMEAWDEAAPDVFEGEPLLSTRLDEIISPNRYAAYVPLYSWNTLRFAPRCDRPEVFQLYAQQTNVYCAVASGQMILDFYKYHFNQDDIAAAMGTGSSGTSNPGQVAGYESLSNNGLDATYDTSAAWSEAKAEIDANRPVKSGIPGHARAVAGWKRQNIYIFGSAPNKWLKVFDPWPWNSNICEGGAVYWENWDTVTHTNWIYVRHS